MRSKVLLFMCVGPLGGLGVGSAVADTMHPQLGARLSGMGEHGIVNLTLKATKHEICWTFEIPTKGVTAASVRTAHGMMVAKLGSDVCEEGVRDGREDGGHADRRRLRRSTGSGWTPRAIGRAAWRAVRRHGSYVMQASEGYEGPRRYGRGVFPGDGRGRSFLARLGEGRLGTCLRRRVADRRIGRADPPVQGLADLHGLGQPAPRSTLRPGGSQSRVAESP